MLSSKGCDNLNCHGGGNGGNFALSPPAAKDAKFDYTQACTQITPADLKSSPLILKPLAEDCGGSTHGGGPFFFSFDDPDYLTLATWVNGGEYR